MSKFKIFILSFVLLAIGGLNWGLIGLFDFNLIGAMFGAMSLLSRIIYIVVGIATIIAIGTMPREN